jgi:hypothetical protein
MQPISLMRFILRSLFFSIAMVSAAKAENACHFSHQLGMKLERFHYRETNSSNQLIDQETGLLPGLTLGAAANCGSWIFSFEAEQQRARLDYDGQSSGGRKILTRTMENIREVSVQAGKRFTISSTDDAVVYGGVGSWRWQRNIEAVGNVAGLDETYRQRFFYLGGNATLFRQAQHQFILDARWLRLVSPTLDVNFKGLYDKTEGLALSAQHGWRVSLPWRYTRDAANAWELEPYAKGWRSNASAAKPLLRNGVVVGDFFEPASDMRQYGIQLSWRHKY